MKFKSHNFLSCHGKIVVVRDVYALWKKNRLSSFVNIKIYPIKSHLFFVEPHEGDL